MSESLTRQLKITKQAVRGKGVVVAQNCKAAEVGAAILRQGGNAIDAAVATGMAIGALERQVLTQFLVEAVVLALFGGVLGIAIGLGLAAAGSAVMDVPFNADLRVIALAFAVSALIGVIFGYFPARRAARLDPIEALRRE